YTMRGESKRDYPASILHQSAWYQEYKHIEDYFSRFGLMMAQGEPVCDLLVINPVETFWSQVHLGWSKGLGLQDEHLKTLEAKYQTLFTWLLESQIDFDYGDEEMMSRLASIEGDMLRVGRASYKTVLISGAETIRSSTLKLLEQFVAAGGKVVVAGEAPTHVDGVEFSGFKFQVSSFSKDAVLEVVPAPQAVVEAADIFGQLRKTEDGLIFAALNVNRDERREHVIVRIKTGLPIEEWNCETGERIPVAAASSNGWKIFTADFPKGGNKLWVASEKFQSLEPAVRAAAPGEWKAVSGPFEYTLSEPNICVLDAAEYRIDAGGSVAPESREGEGGWQPETDVLKIDQKIRDLHGILRRGGEMLQPWFTAQHPVKALCPVELRYTFEIETMPERLDLVIEEPENFTVQLNGHLLDISQKSGDWIDIAFRRVRIPARFLTVGKNEIVLKTLYKENSNLEAIYLLGDFGVQLTGTVRKIIPMPGTVQTGDLCPQGFSFYSGRITYQVPLPEGAKRLRLPSIGGACAKINGQVVGWDPFESGVCGDAAEVEIILTRRNTFGPLHDAVKGRMHTGPDHWLTEGGNFSPEPVVIPSGLLSAPGVFLKR
ncbi:MAG: hypothetical protein WC701_10080, partial [Kiritimatiellales bacterium]